MLRDSPTKIFYMRRTKQKLPSKFKIKQVYTTPATELFLKTSILIYTYHIKVLEKKSRRKRRKKKNKKMPLDTSTYSLALLRIDGRRWNELRQLRGQIRTQAAADGSSYLEMGNTKVMCVVTGPSEDNKRRGGGAGTSSGGTTAQGTNAADIVVSVVVGGFSTTDRKRRGRGDKYVFLFFLLFY